MIKKFILEKKPEKALIIGGGFIGLEMADNLSHLGISVTMIEAAEHVMPSMDSDMAVYIEDHLGIKGVKLITGDSVAEIADDGISIFTKTGKIIETDMIIIAAGVRPDTALVKDKGIRPGTWRYNCK